MANNPAIVVCAYNRPEPLYRLLHSIANSNFEQENVTLIISIDKSNNQDVYALAESFDWKYGEKKIIKHGNHLGLKEHILTCGDLTTVFGSVILLEDDLLVSPYFYEYAKQALGFYNEEDSLAGISLYNYQVAESCFYPFKAIDDGSDVYFMQVASSWGQAWTKEQWTAFRNWFKQNPELPINNTIPDYIKRWGKNSWKKHFIHYLVDTNKYFVFPRLSLTTNFEEEGTNSSTKNTFQVPLQLSECKYLFQSLKNSKSIYDAWFEITSQSLNQHTSILNQYNYEVDLYGIKEHYTKPFVITSQIAANPLLKFGSKLFPLETNVALQVSGNEINLYETNGNTFVKRELELKNYLLEVNKNSDLSISIVIPIVDFNELQLKATLDSIEQQEHSFCEVILVMNKSCEIEVEKIVSYYTFKIQFISSDFHQLDQRISLGFNAAKHEILSWVHSGAEFKNDAFKNVNMIFKSYIGINWINGIQEEVSNKYEYDRLNVFNYRIAPIEIYKRAKTNNFGYSIEGHFFRNECLKSVSLSSFNLKKFYFHLIDNFQLIIIVKCFMQIEAKHIAMNLNSEELNLILEKYKPSSSIASVKAKLFAFLLKAPLIGHESYKWYYTSVNNFPDVLRYDYENNTFYLSKH